MPFHMAHFLLRGSGSLLTFWILRVFLRGATFEGSLVYSHSHIFIQAAGRWGRVKSKAKSNAEVWCKARSDETHGLVSLIQESSYIWAHLGTVTSQPEVKEIPVSKLGEIHRESMLLSLWITSSLLKGLFFFWEALKRKWEKKRHIKISF